VGRQETGIALHYGYGATTAPHVSVTTSWPADSAVDPEMFCCNSVSCTEKYHSEATLFLVVE